MLQGIIVSSMIIPQYIQLYPTMNCNQHCSFCFNREMPQSGSMDYSHAIQLLEIMSAHAIPELDIMGGEPLLLPWMPELIIRALSKNIAVNISTNGSLTAELQKLSGIADERFTIGISLEGSTEERHHKLTGTRHFKNVINNLSLLRSYGLNPLVKTVLSRETADDIQPILNIIKGIGITRYYLIHMDSFQEGGSDTAMGYPEFMEFFGLIKAANADISIESVTASCFNGSAASAGLRCCGGTKKIAVAPDGAVYPCNLLIRFPEFKLGDIYSSGLQEIMSHPALGSFRHNKPATCRKPDCPVRIQCTGGCPAHAYFYVRDLMAPDPRCVHLALQASP